MYHSGSLISNIYLFEDASRNMTNSPLALLCDKTQLLLPKHRATPATTTSCRRPVRRSRAAVPMVGMIITIASHPRIGPECAGTAAAAAAAAAAVPERKTDRSKPRTKKTSPLTHLERGPAGRPGRRRPAAAAAAAAAASSEPLWRAVGGAGAASWAAASGRTGRGTARGGGRT